VAIEFADRIGTHLTLAGEGAARGDNAADAGNQDGYGRCSPQAPENCRVSMIRNTAATLGFLDWRVLAFLFAISLLTGVLFGFFPAFQISRLDMPRC
jgi:hypothetical protein